MYVRVRPPAKNLESDVDRTPCLEVTSGNTVVLQSKPDPKTFSYDHVADINTTQVRFTDTYKTHQSMFMTSDCGNVFVSNMVASNLIEQSLISILFVPSMVDHMVLLSTIARLSKCIWQYFPLL